MNATLGPLQWTYWVHLIPSGIVDSRAIGVCVCVTETFWHYQKTKISDRSLTVIAGGKESKRDPINAGVPQGSFLRSLMLNIYFDDLLQQISEAVAYSSKLLQDNANTSSTRQQRIIDSVSNWGSCWKIQFATEKVQSLIISRSRD